MSQVSDLRAIIDRHPEAVPGLRQLLNILLVDQLRDEPFVTIRALTNALGQVVDAGEVPITETKETSK